MVTTDHGLRLQNAPPGGREPWAEAHGGAMTLLTTAHERDRVIRPAAVLPERAAREILAWLQTHDVSQGGCWSSAVGTIQRYSGPFNGLSGMRGDAVLLGSLHITWDTYEATIY